MQKQLFTSDKKYWETPQALFDELDKEFHFTLDAAASDKNHKCKKYYTERDNGLMQDWVVKQFSVIRRMAKLRPEYGQKNVSKKRKSQALQLFYLFLQGQTERASISIYWDKRRFGLSVDA